MIGKHMNRSPPQKLLQTGGFRLGHRWTICSLIFAATTINYLDRNVLGLLKPVLSEAGVFGVDKATQELNYANVVICFQVAYAVGLLFIGKVIDMVGTKTGYLWSLVGWSFAAIGHAFGHHTWSFGFWRAALGITEAGNFPAANKAVAEWFPRKERALATGLYNSGANVGAIIAPLSVPFIAMAWGWEWAFILTGVVGLAWIGFWYVMYASPAEKLRSGQLSQAEFDYIQGDVEEKTSEGNARSVSWLRLFRFRQTWAFFFGKFLTDPIWWFYLFWLPSFLAGENARKVSEFIAVHPNYDASTEMVPGVISWPFAVAVVYTIATIGSIFGGWLPKRFMARGVEPSQARKLAMLLFALLPLTVLLASWLGSINTWFAVVTIAIACAAHQAWSANIFASVSDMFPKTCVASVTGIGGMAGAVGGILIAFAAGRLLKKYTEVGHVEVGYGILFVICATAYLAAWMIMHILVPRFRQVEL
jgi:ACS family hexuronate transporter-like MFS transporter